MYKKIFFFIFLYIFFIFSDLYSKSYIKNMFEYNQLNILKINGFLNFHPSCNKGISFSFLKNSPRFFLLFFIGFLLLLLLIYTAYNLYQYFKNLHKDNNDCKNIFFSNLGLVFISSGGVANFIDRLKNECVFDFIDIHFFDIHLFIFNLADFYISIGFLMILIFYNKNFIKKKL